MSWYSLGNPKVCHSTQYPALSGDCIPAPRPNLHDGKPMPKYVFLFFLSLCTEGPRSCLFIGFLFYYWLSFFCLERSPRILASRTLSEFLDTVTCPLNWLTHPVLTSGIKSKTFLKVNPLKMAPHLDLLPSQTRLLPD